MKYDLTALKIKVIEEHKPYWQFLVRLCGIIGGIFVVSGKSLNDCTCTDPGSRCGVRLLPSEINLV